MGRLFVHVGCLIVCILGFAFGQGAYDWMTYDAYDRIIDQMDAVTPENCISKPPAELRLHPDSVAQKPSSNILLSTLIYPNRTCLLHLHNMAWNRAYFYSYINQALNNSKEDFLQQPGLMYYYMSAEADVAANPGCINGSAAFYDNNCSYANWYTNLEFNHTLPLFGARAWRFDDYNEPTNWLREPTNYTINIEDYGAGPEHNYSNPSYKLNEFYNIWMPDVDDSLDSLTKNTYTIGLKYSNETGSFTHGQYTERSFYGPSSPGQKEKKHLPVKFTAPYYDCGRSNKWMISATSPILDFLPRYLIWDHIRRQRFVGAIVMDTDFLKIDINPCPLGEGNPAPNVFGDTSRCSDTTRCEPYHGWGFQRGGYECACRPGHHYPAFQSGPYHGEDIERATNYENKRGFDCIKTGWTHILPIIDGDQSYVDTGVVPGLGKKKKRSVRSARTHVKSDLLKSRKKRAIKARARNNKERFLAAANVALPQELPSTLRAKRHVPKQDTLNLHPQVEKAREERAAESTAKKAWVPRYERDTVKHRTKRDYFDRDAHDRMHRLMNHMRSVTKQNCREKTADELVLPGDVAYGADEQLQNQARTALRLAHFISNFMENVDFYEEYGTLRGDKPLNVELMFGEVIANVMADYKIFGSGIFFDTDKFINLDGSRRQYFGPYAYKAATNVAENKNIYTRAVDFAGEDELYIEDDWFVSMKERWQSNVYGLKKWTTKALIRSDLDGTALRRFEHYPMYYRAPSIEDGQWTKPYFDCDGYVDDWIVTYSVPFFGMNKLRTHIEFKGVATVDVKLEELDIHQCPMPFHVANAFKSTSRCHYESTECVHLAGKKFALGSYKCECRQGFEYPFNDQAWYFDGQTMEAEYQKLMNPKILKDRFETLKCRPSTAAHTTVSAILLLSLAAIYNVVL